MTPSPTRETPLSGLPRGLHVLLTVAAAIIVVAGLRSFASSIGPMFLALVVVVVVSPVYHWLRRLGFNGPLATAGLAVTAFGVLAVMLAALIWTVTRLVQLLTSDFYTTKLSETQADIETLLAKWGYTSDDLGAAMADIDLTSVAGQVTSALSSVLGITSAIGLILFSMLFMVMDTGAFTAQLNAISEVRPAVVDAFRGFAQRTRSYFVVSTLFGLIVAALDVVALMILGIPLPFVWGVLSLITNYIPNVGFVLGLIPPATLAFFEGGWQLSVWVIVIYTAINVIIQSAIQPKIVGDAVGLSATLTFVSLIFWGWVLGPLGALLAVPMTLFSKAMLVDIDPTTNWAAPLIALSSSSNGAGPEPPPEPDDVEMAADAADSADSTDSTDSEADGHAGDELEQPEIGGPRIGDPEI
ncbi:MAG: AI-2E family transporter [Acidimicrobiia bacterium]|nr:AI-2E family transporter [Acidimicrobiia bacterium]